MELVKQWNGNIFSIQFQTQIHSRCQKSGSAETMSSQCLTMCSLLWDLTNNLNQVQLWDEQACLGVHSSHFHYISLFLVNFFSFFVRLFLISILVPNIRWSVWNNTNIANQDKVLKLFETLLSIPLAALYFHSLNMSQLLVLGKAEYGLP